MNGLIYLERREFINGFKRMLREPRRLLILAPLVFLLIRVEIPHPHTNYLAPYVFDLLVRSLAVLLGLGLLIRFSIPAEPLYMAEPADAVFILPASVAPWQLMLRRHWLTLVTYFRTFIGFLYMVTFLPIPLEQSGLLLIFAVLYMILLTEVGILSYRLGQYRVPTSWFGRAGAVFYLGYALWPFLKTNRVSLPHLIPLVRLGWLGTVILEGMKFGMATGLWAVLVIILAILTLVTAPALQDIDIGRVRLLALTRQARRGESQMSEVSRARALDRMQRSGRSRVRTTHRFWGQGYIALTEAKLVMAVRGLRSRWIPVLLGLSALGGGLLVARTGPSAPIFALTFLSYISMFGLATGPLMMTQPLLVGVPRTVGLLWAEEIPTLAAWLGLYLLLWTVAAASGLDAPLTAIGYTWIIAFQIVMASWRLFLWSLFPESNLRYTVGRAVSVIGGLMAAAIPLLGIATVPFPWGIPVTLGTAVLESWLINRLTLSRLTWAISHSRIAGQE